MAPVTLCVGRRPTSTLSVLPRSSYDHIMLTFRPVMPS